MIWYFITAHRKFTHQITSHIFHFIFSFCNYEQGLIPSNIVVGSGISSFCFTLVLKCSERPQLWFN
jgi:hypothetical protein